MANALDILHELCSTPTAPFAEHHVVRYVERFAIKRGLKLSRDDFGNLLLEIPGRKAAGPRWVFGAHMDHPGLVADRMLDETTLHARFHGWVQIDYVKGEKVRFFIPHAEAERSGTPRSAASGTSWTEVEGTITDATPDEHDRLTVPSRVTVKVAARVPKGSPGMWDQGAGRTKNGKFYSRVCDDLAGAAAALAMIDELARKPAKANVAVLLTRAEEEGFIGAIAAATQPKLLKKSDRIIAIETSAMQPYAPQGNGAIVRVGDRTSVFNSDLSYFITTQAEALAKKDKSFKYQRALMPGGTCEATVYDIYGFTASAICVALGNYHNMDKDRKRIAPEYIDLNDWTSMVQLFLHVARTAHTYEPGHKLLKQRVEKRFNKFRKFL